MRISEFTRFMIVIGIAVGFLFYSTHSYAKDLKKEADTVTLQYTDVEPFSVTEVYTGYEVTKKGDRYDIYLGNRVGSIDLYTDLIRGLKKLKKSDIVVLHVANYGGQVMSGAQIMNAMIASRATIVVELEGPSYSMGALLACAGDKLYVHSNSYLMFHTFSGTFGGKASDSKAHMAAIETMINNMLTDQCVKKGILTLDQVDIILGGQDVYIHPKDINSSYRINNP